MESLILHPMLAGAAALVSTLVWQDPAVGRAPMIIADSHFCGLARGAYCILEGEGRAAVTGRPGRRHVWVRFDDGAPAILITESGTCEGSLSGNPYIAEISRRRGKLSLRVRLDPGCEMHVSVPDHRSEPSGHAAIVALTQINLCLRACEVFPRPLDNVRPLATLISRHALGWGNLG